jgi:S-adenosylmethionine synthetase
MRNTSSIKSSYNLRTAEFVSPKHPDKICDQISDAILDAYLAKDPDSRVAVDVAGGHGTIFITGEVTSAAKIDIVPIVRRLAGNLEIINRLSHQSPEIARGVDTGGAGDQGIMVGYACDETPELLPLEYVLARSLNQFLYAKYPYDGKTQVTTKDGKIESIVASFQNVTSTKLRAQVLKWLGLHSLADNSIKIYPNPCGDWNLGGFDADSGLTGRKLAVDNYGPRVPLGGGAFSGKDPTKVDRSAAYMARTIAVDYLKDRHAHEVYVYLAYAIGRAEPLEATVVVDGVHEEITGYDLTPKGIIAYLDLKKPQYEKLARAGHF